jgi:fatty acid desaturase
VVVRPSPYRALGHAPALFRRKFVFRYSEDRIPVALAAALTVVDFALYFTVESPWLLAGYWLLMIVPKGVIAAWSHHHQHVNVFRTTFLNRALELSHALHTGITTHLWLLHHVFGHHLNYLDQTKDESRWRRKSGRIMGMIEYSFSILFTAYYRGYQVGKRYPKHQRVFVTFATLTLVIVFALVAYKPVSALFLFVLPMIVSLLFTAWVTYDHHAGLDSQDAYEASFNIMNRRFNQLTGNLGYHTAHHQRQGVHWSRLPELHAQIADKIPPHLYRKTTFDLFLRDAPSADA